MICLELDTNSCCTKIKGQPIKFYIEKKIESSEEVSTYLTPLLSDIDNDCVSEIIIPDKLFNGVLIINSKTGDLISRISTYNMFSYYNCISVADINLDGIPEIFIIASDLCLNPSNIQGRLLCYNINGNLIWVSDQRVEIKKKNLSK